MRRSAYSGMPISFRVPVVGPRVRCAWKPRSGPLQRSSASPIAATGATPGTAIPTAAPTSGSRSPPEVHRLRATGEHQVGELAPSVREPPQVAPRCPMLELELDLLHLEAGPHRRRSSSASRRRNPSPPGTRLRAQRPRGAAGRRAARAERDHTGAGSECAQLISPTPSPPPTRVAKAAMASSVRRSTSGRRSPRRSASQRSSGPGSSWRSASVQRLPLAKARKPDHPRAGSLGTLGCRVPRAVVRDHDQRRQGTAPAAP